MRKKPILTLLTVLLVAGAGVIFQPWTKVPQLISQVSGTKVTQPANPGQSGTEPTQEGQTSEGSQPTKGKQPSAQALQFSYLSLPKAPQAVQKLAQQNRDKESTALLVVNATPYIIATRGVKPTAGYGVEITGITMEDVEGKPIINLKMKYTDPQPGQVTAQVLTYPMVIAKLELLSIPQGLIIQVETN